MQFGWDGSSIMKNRLDICMSSFPFLVAYMYPAERNELHLILDIKDLFLVHRVAAVGRAMLLRRNNMRYIELVMRQMASQHATSLNVVGGIGMRQLQEHFHGIPRYIDGAQRARQQRISAVILRLPAAIKAGFRGRTARQSNNHL